MCLPFVKESKRKSTAPDEPTGNLYPENSERIFEILLSLNSRGLTIIMVTHNPDLAGKAKSIIKLKDGKIVSK